MNNLLDNLYRNQSIIFKFFLLALSVFLIVYFFPTGGQFKYEIIKGKPWQYENLYAPFDFAILKSDEEIAAEKSKIRETHIPYYEFDVSIAEQVKNNWKDQLESQQDSLVKSNKEFSNFISETIDEIYKYGIRIQDNGENDYTVVFLIKSKQVEEVLYKDLLTQEDLKQYLVSEIEEADLSEFRNLWKDEEVNVTFYIPEGVTVYFDNTVKNFLYNVDNDKDIYDKDMANHHFKMTDKTLTCTDCIDEDDDEIEEETL